MSAERTGIRLSLAGNSNDGRGRQGEWERQLRKNKQQILGSEYSLTEVGTPPTHDLVTDWWPMKNDNNTTVFIIFMFMWVEHRYNFLFLCIPLPIEYGSKFIIDW